MKKKRNLQRGLWDMALATMFVIAALLAFFVALLKSTPCL